MVERVEIKREDNIEEKKVSRIDNRRGPIETNQGFVGDDLIIEPIIGGNLRDNNLFEHHDDGLGFSISVTSDTSINDSNKDKDKEIPDVRYEGEDESHGSQQSTIGGHNVDVIQGKIGINNIEDDIRNLEELNRMVAGDETIDLDDLDSLMDELNQEDSLDDIISQGKDESQRLGYAGENEVRINIDMCMEDNGTQINNSINTINSQEDFNNDYLSDDELETISLDDLEDELYGEIQEPITQKPITQKPIIQKPIIQKTITQKPVIQEPIIQEPITQEPIVQEPITQEPIVPEPVIQKPITQEPVIQEPIIQKPIIPEPVVQEPIIQKSIVQNLFEWDTGNKSQGLGKEISTFQEMNKEDDWEEYQTEDDCEDQMETIDFSEIMEDDDEEEVIAPVPRQNKRFSAAELLNELRKDAEIDMPPMLELDYSDNTVKELINKLDELANITETCRNMLKQKAMGVESDNELSKLMIIVDSLEKDGSFPDIPDLKIDGLMGT